MGTAGATDAAGSTGSAGAGGTRDDAGTTDADDAAPPDVGVDALPDALPDVPLDEALEVPVECSDRNIINACNWNETRFPFGKRRMLLRDEGDPHVVLLDFGQANPVVWKTVASGPWARGLQLIGNNQVMGSRLDGYEVFDLTTGDMVKSVTTFLNVQSAYRMATGETMLTRSGTSLDFLDNNDKVAHSITYPGFGFVRVARPTIHGTFLVPSDTVLFEGDDTGKVLWKTTVRCAAPPCDSTWSQIYEPRLMADGNVLLSTFFGASLDVVDQNTHLVTKSFGTKKMTNAAVIKPNGFAGFQILPNGNIITANWQGHSSGNGGSGVQVLEFNPAGDVVWTYQQDPTVFSSIQDVLVIDGMDPRSPHALETSTNGAWQPLDGSGPGPIVDPLP